MSISVSPFTLLSHVDFSTIANTSTGAAGTQTGWGSTGWIDVLGGKLSVSGGIGVIGNSTTQPLPELAKYSAQQANALIVVRAKFSNTSGYLSAWTRGTTGSSALFSAYNGTNLGIYGSAQTGNSNGVGLNDSASGNDVYIAVANATTPFFLHLRFDSVGQPHHHYYDHRNLFGRGAYPADLQLQRYKRDWKSISWRRGSRRVQRKLGSNFRHLDLRSRVPRITRINGNAKANREIPADGSGRRPTSQATHRKCWIQRKQHRWNNTAIIDCGNDNE